MKEKRFDPNKRLFVNQTTVIAAASTTTAAPAISFDSSGDFVLVYMNFWNGGAAAGDLSVKMEDSGVNKGFFKAAIKTDLIFGDGKQPFEMPADTIIKAGSSMAVEIANSTGTPRTVQLALIGYLVPKGYMERQATATNAAGQKVVRR